MAKKLMKGCEAIGEAVQSTVRVSIEIEGSERPGCVVDTISRYTFND